MAEQRLDWAQRRFLLALGLPALGLALAVTVISSYLPVLVEKAGGPLVAGALIGGEGLFGIFMPVLVGARLDRTSAHVRDRFRYLVVFAVVVVAALVAIAIAAQLGPDSVWPYAAALCFLYAGYYGFLAPYWALYPDLVPDEQSGRSRSFESTTRVIGVGAALVGGGLLLQVWAGLPFLTAAVVVVACAAALLWMLRGRGDREVAAGDRDEHSVAAIRDLLSDRHILLLSVANGLWNFALASLRAFVVLFFTSGLNRSTGFVATVIFPLVALGIAATAPTAGWAADRWGHVRLLMVALTVYAVGMSVPAFVQAPWVIALIPVVAAGAAAVMTLPFSMLMRLIPEQRHGAASGLFGFSRGVGALLGPLVTGLAIAVSGSLFSSTDGYAAMWVCCSAALLASIPLLWSLRRDDRL